MGEVAGLAAEPPRERGGGENALEREFRPGGAFGGRDLDIVGALAISGLTAMTLFVALRGWGLAGTPPAQAVAALATLPMNLLIVIGFLTRAPPVETPRAGEFLVPLASAISPGAAMSLGVYLPVEWGTTLGYAIAGAGVALSCAALLHLRRSFAILPAVRAVVTTGPYRAVRHPLYLGEFLYVLGFMLLAAGWWSVVAAAVLLGLLAWRILIEERKLRARPEYREYAARVKHRLFPGAW